MESIWKTVVAFAVIILITALGITITSVNMEVTAAGNYLEEVSAVIQESNYSLGIIRQCEAEAEQNGYRLEVERYENPEHAGEAYARVCLHYRYRLPVLGVEEWKTKEKLL